VPAQHVPAASRRCLPFGARAQTWRPHLNAMSKMGPLPWSLSFSYGLRCRILPGGVEGHEATSTPPEGPLPPGPPQRIARSASTRRRWRRQPKPRRWRKLLSATLDQESVVFAHRCAISDQARLTAIPSTMPRIFSGGITFFARSAYSPRRNAVLRSCSPKLQHAVEGAGR